MVGDEVDDPVDPLSVFEAMGVHGRRSDRSEIALSISLIAAPRNALRRGAF